MTEKKEASFKEVKDLISSIVKLRNRLLEVGIGKEDSITDGYAKWFCSKKYNLKLTKKEKQGYNGYSRFNDKA